MRQYKWCKTLTDSTLEEREKNECNILNEIVKPQNYPITSKKSLDYETKKTNLQRYKKILLI